MSLNPARTSQGFTLLEVLIAALVLGVGLLGLAGLQTLGLRGSLSAVQRSVATQLAAEIIDRIRANPGALGNYDNQAGTGSIDCLWNLCSDAQTADYDLSQWAAEVKKRLPNGTGVVCTDGSPDDGTPTSSGCGGGGTYTVKIWWDDDRSGDAEQYQRFSTSFSP